MNAPLMVVVVSFALCQCCATWHFFGKPASGPEQNQASLRLGVECRVRLGGDGRGFVAGADTAFRKRNQPPGQFAFLLTKEVVSVPADALAFISIRVKTKFRGLVNVSGWPGCNGSSSSQVTRRPIRRIGDRHSGVFAWRAAAAVIVSWLIQFSALPRSVAVAK